MSPWKFSKRREKHCSRRGHWRCGFVKLGQPDHRRREYRCCWRGLYLGTKQVLILRIYQPSGGVAGSTVLETNAIDVLRILTGLQDWLHHKDLRTLFPRQRTCVFLCPFQFRSADHSFSDDRGKGKRTIRHCHFRKDGKVKSNPNNPY